MGTNNILASSPTLLMFTVKTLFKLQKLRHKELHDIVTQSFPAFVVRCMLTALSKGQLNLFQTITFIHFNHLSITTEVIQVTDDIFSKSISNYYSLFLLSTVPLNAEVSCPLGWKSRCNVNPCKHQLLIFYSCF